MEEKTAAQRKWRLVGDYFENRSCDIVCPCLVSIKAALLHGWGLASF
jgi:hypothetical protein